jgi:ankyrin repeat protein/beta-lactamase regulating signal transducer with metallopeptidase domain
MNVLGTLFRLPVIIPLGWALLHFLWQGALIALLLAAVNLLLQRADARLRYAADCIALVLMLAAAVSTFVWLIPASAPEDRPPKSATLTFQTVAPYVAQAAPAISTGSSFRWEPWLDRHLTWLVCAWFAGVVVLSLRIAGGWIFARSLKRRAWPAAPSWQQTLARLAIRFGVRRRIALCESMGARVPAVIGWLRPVILLPVSAMAGLTPQMIEAVLAHELAHIRRHDYLLNVLQTAVETLLFYHPSVWWVGKKIRQERENCCDDLAVAACGDALIYARALTALEDIRSTPPRLAVAATAGSLLVRIRRLVEARQPAGNPAITCLAGVTALLALGTLWAARPISVVSRSREATSSAAIRPLMAAQITAPEAKAAELVAQVSPPGNPSAPRGSLPVTSPAKSPRDEMTAGQMFKRATKDGDLQTVETLLSLGFDPNAPVDGHGYRPLWYAISSGSVEVVELLLAAHADPNPKLVNSPFYATPLRLALQLRNLQMASDLVEAGAHVDAKGNDGLTVLYYEVRSVHLDAIRLLIEKGADVNVRDSEGASLLDDAVWTGSVDTVALLLAHGARLNEPDPETGATPINEAAYRGNPEVVQYLLQFHPDLGIADKRGYTPLDNALRMDREDAALLLLEAEPKAPQTSFGKLMDQAIKIDKPRLIEALLRHGVSANGTLPSGSTPLESAAFADATKAVQVLLDNGADPNLGTPLEDAALKGFDSIVSQLLDHGALINHADNDSGATALYAAASFGKVAVVKLLLSRGANSNLCGKNHKTPYQVALDNGYNDVAAEIKLHGGGDICKP